MRLLHCVTSTDPTTGGPIEAITQLGKELIRSGHSPEIVSADAPSAPWVQKSPIPIHPLGPPVTSYGYSPRLRPWLRMHAHEYDIVIANGIWQYNSFATWRALRKSSPPYVVFPHGMLDPWFKHQYPFKHLKKWLYWPWAQYRILRDARAVIFTCEEERILARQSFWLYDAVERVVAYGTADPTLSPAQRNAFLTRFPGLQGTPYLLFLGRIHEKKGCDLLLTAFAAEMLTSSETLLVIAGPDATGLRPALESLASSLGISDRVTWTGPLVGDLKWGAFQGAEAFVLPSHQENFGIAVAEALACGLPVLITDKVNIWREIAAGGGGIVFDDTVQGLSAALRSWRSASAPARKEMAMGARKTFREHFEISGTAKSLLGIFEDILGVGPGAERG